MTWERTLSDLVEERTGIALAPRQLRHDVRRKIDRRIEALGLRGPEAWVWHLAQASPSDAEFTWLIEAVTVGYSYFFRDVEQLRVAIEVLRDLADRPRVRSTLQVWCAGCSTGQEPWSLAILAQQAGLSVQVLGTDINPKFLDLARAGVYPIKALQQVPSSLRPGLSEGPEGVVVRPEHRSSVRFALHNLVDPGPYPIGGDGGRFDLILCRNVFIYFSRTSRERIATRFSRALEPRGWLFLGPGETLEDVDVPMAGRLWGRRLGYNPATLVEGRVYARTPTPMPARRSGRVVPAPAAADPLQQAVLTAKTGQFDRAEAMLLDYARQQGDPDAWLALAHLRLKVHDFDGALSATAQVLAADSLSAEAHLAAGVAHRKLGNIEQAVSSLRQALFVDPDLWQAGVLLAGAHARQGRERDRRAALRRAREAVERTGGRTTTTVPDFEVEGIAGGPERARAAVEVP